MHEASLGIPPQEALPYSELSHDELIDEFYRLEGDPDIGRALGVRLIEHADISDIDPQTAPLTDRAGKQVELDRKPAVLADYVNFAAQNHFGALPQILGFLRQKPGEEDYKTTRDIIAAMVRREHQ